MLMIILATFLVIILLTDNTYLNTHIFIRTITHCDSETSEKQQIQAGQQGHINDTDNYVYLKL